MKKQLIYILVLLLFPVVNIAGQNIVLKTTKGRLFYEEYYVLKSDTSVKNGIYIRKFRDYIVERGAYKNGEKFGIWVYFSLDGMFEFEYDYNLKKVTKIANRQTQEEYMRTPVFFDGSPIIPYLYLVSHVCYPDEAKNKDITGRISLQLNISHDGQITALSLSKNLHPLLDKEVLKVAKTFPADWKWIPATYNGNNIDSEYQIDIEFELYEK